jgi:chemotaxis response regulator CheB
MRVLCVGRHEYLSEHLCRYFREVGAECEPAVGAADALRRAATFEPHVVVSDGEQVTAALLEAWAAVSTLADVPVLAVSLTPPLDDAPLVEAQGAPPVIYLPSLSRVQARALLDNVRRPSGVSTPAGWWQASAIRPQSAPLR